jgi:hypothetical protein
MYGPYVNPNHYKPIKEEFRWSDGCHDNKTLVETALGVGAASMIGTIVYMLVLLFIVTFALNLAIRLIIR